LKSNSEGLKSNSEGLIDRELQISEPARQNKKLNKHTMENIIIALCTERSQTVDKLGDLLERSPDFLRTSYLNPLIKQGKLAYKYKEKNNPQQAYVVPRGADAEDSAADEKI
jgi:hypothetical protein